mmetsp:Transcript_4821/g.14405  ORF Transcript_4821/g.14405 Transcript_4821/m.14405 type:complete len:227 (+) Transcript_4821:481-1161(+)
MLLEEEASTATKATFERAPSRGLSSCLGSCLGCCLGGFREGSFGEGSFGSGFGGSILAFFLRRSRASPRSSSSPPRHLSSITHSSSSSSRKSLSSRSTWVSLKSSGKWQHTLGYGASVQLNRMNSGALPQEPVLVLLLYDRTLSDSSCARRTLSLATRVRATRENGMKCVLARRDVNVEAHLATRSPRRSSWAQLTSRASLWVPCRAVTRPRYALSDRASMSSSLK